MNRYAALGTIALLVGAGCKDNGPTFGAIRVSVATTGRDLDLDGYALIVKSAVGTPDAEGRVHTDEVPDAPVLGCFWAFGEDRPIGAIRAQWLEATEERSRETSCVTMVELLRAKGGRRELEFVRSCLSLPRFRDALARLSRAR